MIEMKNNSFAEVLTQLDWLHCFFLNVHIQYFSGVHSRSFLTKIFACINRLPPLQCLVSAAARKSFNNCGRVRSAETSDTISFGNRSHTTAACFSSIIGV